MQPPAVAPARSLHPSSSSSRDLLSGFHSHSIHQLAWQEPQCWVASRGLEMQRCRVRVALPHCVPTAANSEQLLQPHQALLQHQCTPNNTSTARQIPLTPVRWRCPEEGECLCARPPPPLTVATALGYQNNEGNATKSYWGRWAEVFVSPMVLCPLVEL